MWRLCLWIRGAVELWGTESSDDGQGGFFVVFAYVRRTCSVMRGVLWFDRYCDGVVAAGILANEMAGAQCSL